MEQQGSNRRTSNLALPIDGEDMRYAIILSLLMIGCSSEEKPKTDLVKFAMECKKVANKLKVDFIVEGNDERPGCVIGQKDNVYGGKLVN